MIQCLWCKYIALTTEQALEHWTGEHEADPGRNEWKVLQ